MKVAIIFGSKSDTEVMRGAANALREFDIPFEAHVLSAHRVPEKLSEVIKNLEDTGCEAIIAGAGGAAHLPGIFAAVNTCPVIGVPIHSKALNGIDSLYSIVQMPSGIPVATVAINGAKNAAILATQIIGVSNEDIRNKLADFKAGLKYAVMEKDAKLQDVGYENY